MVGFVLLHMGVLKIGFTCSHEEKNKLRCYINMECFPFVL